MDQASAETCVVCLRKACALPRHCCVRVRENLKYPIKPLQFSAQNCRDHRVVRETHHWPESVEHHRSWKRALWLSDNDEVGAELLLQWAAGRAQRLVEKLWPQIHRLAFALLEKERLSGGEINQVIETTEKYGQRN
jgi:hypothetical protein